MRCLGMLIPELRGLPPQATRYRAQRGVILAHVMREITPPGDRASGRRLAPRQRSIIRGNAADSSSMKCAIGASASARVPRPPRPGRVTSQEQAENEGCRIGHSAGTSSQPTPGHSDRAGPWEW
jgi:hypothetical protein